MIDAPKDDWSFSTAREPARFGACEVNGAPGVEHAVDGRRTLCGISARHTTRHLHLFVAGALQSCRRCRQKAEASPTQPCVQERLYGRVLESAQGAMRDELLAALRKGAPVRLWINGPSADLAKSYASFDELTDGAGPAAEAFASAETIGLANVEYDLWRFLVVLPQDGGPPIIARGARGPTDTFRACRG
ncbi:hypothetical protein [Streptomyces sp. NRRL F-5123]|uniref:hypothetical protein n=1 Tax=Streptomyces sp. NRRL F-5123 TaxID=1463856 RepID=UPI00131B9368|nr:hypothetical protein [Streptomyces sp. NRRL F-5123]